MSSPRRTLNCRPAMKNIPPPGYLGSETTLVCPRLSKTPAFHLPCGRYPAAGTEYMPVIGATSVSLALKRALGIKLQSEKFHADHE